MIAFINDSGFITCAGKFYYLWREKYGNTVVLYLGNNKGDFKRFLDKIREVYRGQRQIFFIHKKSADIERAVISYLEGKINKINFNIEFLTGTEFQKNIWKKLISVPYGKTISYRELSEISGYSKAWRAAGSALKDNPLMLIIPCHRVIRSDGDSGEFKGGARLKKFLIDMEKKLKTS
jgi:O-6-methylguanine DNA methyltransferase